MNQYPERPLISVIIPVYNREKFVAEAIQSVLGQAYEPLELFVVDDGSTDGSAAIIRQFEPRLTYLYQENKGISAARNAGIAHARGEFLAFLDSDDIWMPDKLHMQMAVFSAEPQTDVVFGHTQQFFDEKDGLAFQATVKNEEKVMPAPIAPAMLIRRAVFDAAGWYNPDVSVATDPEWYMRLQEQNPRIVMLPEIVYKRRIHQHNTTLVKQAAIRKEYLRMIREGLRRRKQQ